MTYQFNECGVCTNPTIYGRTIVKKGLVLTNKIRVAQMEDGRWCYGIDFEPDDLGHGAGYGDPCCKNNGGFPSKRSAVVAAAKKMRYLAEHSAQYYKCKYDKVIECCDKALAECVEELQLSLF